MHVLQNVLTAFVLKLVEYLLVWVCVYMCPSVCLSVCVRICCVSVCVYVLESTYVYLKGSSIHVHVVFLLLTVCGRRGGRSDQGGEVHVVYDFPWLLCGGMRRERLRRYTRWRLFLIVNSCYV